MLAKRSNCPLDPQNPPNWLPIIGICTFLCPRRPSPTINDGNRPTPQRSRLSHSTFRVVRLPLFPSKGEIGPRGRCCGQGGSDVPLADFHFPQLGMAVESPKPFLFLRREANWADSENSRGILSVWLAREHHFSKVVLWLTPNAGFGPGIRGLPPGRARLRKWRPSHALEASGVALTWPWRGPDVALTWVWRAGAVLVSGPNPSRT